MHPIERGGPKPTDRPDQHKHRERREQDTGHQAQSTQDQSLIKIQIERGGCADGNELSSTGQHPQTYCALESQLDARRGWLFLICPRDIAQRTLQVGCAATVALCARIGPSS